MKNPNDNPKRSLLTRIANVFKGKNRQTEEVKINTVSRCRREPIEGYIPKKLKGKVYQPIKIKPFNANMTKNEFRLYASERGFVVEYSGKLRKFFIQRALTANLNN